MTGAHLREAGLSGVHLASANLTHAILAGANLMDALLTDAQLDQADLTGANLLGAHLNRADLSGAKLTGAVLQRADLSGANLVGATITRDQLMEAQNAEKAKLPPGVRLAQKGLENNRRRLAAARVTYGAELIQLVHHLIEFYQDEKANAAYEYADQHLRTMQAKHQVLARKVTDKAKEFVNWHT